MKHKVFAIYDSVTKTYSHPELDMNAGSYLRRVKDVISSSESKLGKHAADHTVFELGEYEDSTGQFSQLEAKINLGELITLKEM